MINFFEIPKNAHASLNSLLLPVTKNNADIEVVCLREPLVRFWDACKTITPELSPFGDFPWTPESVRNAPTSYDGVDLTVEEVIASVKTKLQNNQTTLHLNTQTSLIGDKLFDHVIKVETLQADIEQLCTMYDIDVPFIPVTNVSVKDWDNEAMTIINKDAYLKEYYAEDIALYSNPNDLLR